MDPLTFAMGAGAVPRLVPDQRDPAEVAPAETYRRDDPVWIYRDGAWHRGIVNGASARAVMVRYQPTGSRGTAVDTVTAEFVVHPTDPDRVGGDG